MIRIAVVNGRGDGEQLGAGGINLGSERRGTCQIDINGSRQKRRRTSQAERQSEEQCFFHIFIFLLV
jgi:hypothetical protein